MAEPPQSDYIEYDFEFLDNPRPREEILEVLTKRGAQNWEAFYLHGQPGTTDVTIWFKRTVHGNPPA